jgi:hypothetical protein
MNHNPLSPCGQPPGLPEHPYQPPVLPRLAEPFPSLCYDENSRSSAVSHRFSIQRRLRYKNFTAPFKILTSKSTIKRAAVESAFKNPLFSPRGLKGEKQRRLQSKLSKHAIPYKIGRNFFIAWPLTRAKLPVSILRAGAFFVYPSCPAHEKNSSLTAPHADKIIGNTGK